MVVVVSIRAGCVRIRGGARIGFCRLIRSARRRRCGRRWSLGRTGRRGLRRRGGGRGFCSCLTEEGAPGKPSAAGVCRRAKKQRNDQEQRAAARHNNNPADLHFSLLYPHSLPIWHGPELPDAVKKCFQFFGQRPRKFQADPVRGWANCRAAACRKFLSSEAAAALARSQLSRGAVKRVAHNGMAQ